MFTNVHDFSYNSVLSCNQPMPLYFAKNKFDHKENDYREDWKGSTKAESQSSNASCDTSIDETLSICSKDSKPKIVCLNPYSSIELFETRSIDSGDKSQRYDLSENKKKICPISWNQKKRSVPDSLKYKTELCKKWIQTGQCSYGGKCRFAHGRHELQEKHLQNKSSYRSKKCHSFHTNLFCPYGIRCLFAHESRTLEDLKKEIDPKFESSPDLIKNLITVNRKRLPAFCSRCPVENEAQEWSKEGQVEYSC